MATTSQGSVGTSHAVSLARSAREKLAGALAELQAEGVPSELVDNAAGVARAMGLLLQYEKTGIPSLTEAALGAVREALGALQGLHANHPAAERATGLVAGSLALIHSLGELAQLHGQSATAARDPVPEKSRRSADDTDTVRLGRRARSPDSSDGLPYVEPPAWLREERPANEQDIAVPNDEARRRHRAAEPAASAPSGTSEAPAERPSTRAAKRKKHAERDVVEAALGTHSATNFFRGLNSSDVIEGGGLFIATYQVRRLGETLLLVVTLPGGYEFMARGVVRWTRELPRTASMNPDAPPGFGIKFVEISEAARRLVARYVNNREPLLHDDG